MKYEIQGGQLPVLICNLESGEKMINESGAMCWMSPNMHMDTSTNGGIGKALGRFLTGDKMFQNIYTAQGGDGMIAFASCFPGSIKPFEIAPGHEMILQKRAFLASTAGIELSVHLQKKIGAGLFGGEGFIMQKISGQGIVFAEFDGHVVEYDLKPGQSLIVDTGNLAAVEGTVDIDIQTVKGAKNILFGGESFFNTKLTGPGKVWLQTISLSELASALIPYMPSSSSD